MPGKQNCTSFFSKNVLAILFSTILAVSSLTIYANWRQQTLSEIEDLTSKEIVNLNYPYSVNSFSVYNHILGPYGTEEAFSSSCGDIEPGRFLLEIFENGNLLKVDHHLFRPYMMHVETNGTISFGVTVVAERVVFHVHNPERHRGTIAVGVMWNSRHINTVIDYVDGIFVYKTSSPNLGSGFFACNARNVSYACVEERQVADFAKGNVESNTHYEGGAWTFLYGFGCLSTDDKDFIFIIASGKDKDFTRKIAFDFDRDVENAKIAWTSLFESFSISGQASDRRLIRLRLYQLFGEK
ncbi:hypothetical protein KEJ39_02025 [Candidatus Bathyarchaeota archaeon]|nr:hypothetical protein [Candidatus Bathyarchaeota archaeon]